jgi:hypothetical protein
MAKFYLETPIKSEEGIERGDFYHENIDEDISFKRMTPDKKSAMVSKRAQILCLPQILAPYFSELVSNC